MERPGAYRWLNAAKACLAFGGSPCSFIVADEIWEYQWKGIGKWLEDGPNFSRPLSDGPETHYQRIKKHFDFGTD